MTGNAGQLSPNQLSNTLIDNLPVAVYTCDSQGLYYRI
jgi:hypothetical protein